MNTTKPAQQCSKRSTVTSPDTCGRPLSLVNVFAPSTRSCRSTGRRCYFLPRAVFDRFGCFFRERAREEARTGGGNDFTRYDPVSAERRSQGFGGGSGVTSVYEPTWFEMLR